MSSSATKRIAKNFSWLMAGNVISSIATFFTIVYIARVLGAAAFGLFAFAQAFLLYILILVDSGLSMFGMREVARNRAQAAHIATNIFAVRCLVAMGIFFVALLLLFIIPESSELRLLFIFTFLFIFHRALNADWFFQGIEKMQWITVSKVSFSLLSLGTIIWLINGPVDLLKVPLIQFVCGFSVSLVVFIFIIRRFVPVSFVDFKPRIWQKYLMVAIPLAGSLILIQINYNMDTIMLGIMDRPVVVGYYNAAYKLFFVLLGLFGAWQSTVLPAMNQRMKDDLEQAIRLSYRFVRLTLLAFIPLCFLVFLLAPLIVKLIFGSTYLPAGLVLQLLIWSLVPILLGSSYSVMWLISAGKFKEFSWSAAVGAGLNIILNLFLIPRYSMYGAVIATIISGALSMAMSAYLAQQVHRLNLFKFIIMPLLLVAIALLPFWFITGLTNALPLTARLAINSLTFILSYGLLALGLERQFIFSFVKEILNRN